MINIDTMTPVPEFEADMEKPKAPQSLLSRLASKVVAYFSKQSPAPTPSPERESNRKLAYEILKHVQKTVLFSSNYPERSAPQHSPSRYHTLLRYKF